jgi:IS30 family transposase
MKQSTCGYTPNAGISYHTWSEAIKSGINGLSGRKSRVSRIPHRVDITERPPHAELRAQAGHWEVDTLISRESKACVAVLVERKTLFFWSSS